MNNKKVWGVHGCRAGKMPILLKQYTLEPSILTNADSLVFALFPSLLVLANFTNEGVKCIVNSHPCFRRGLNKRHSVLLCHLIIKTQKFKLSI